MERVTPDSSLIDTTFDDDIAICPWRQVRGVDSKVPEVSVVQVDSA